MGGSDGLNTLGVAIFEGDGDYHWDLFHIVQMTAWDSIWLCRIFGT